MKKDLHQPTHQELLTEHPIKKAIAAEFTPLKQSLSKCFARPKTQASALAYVQGLMSGVERKNSWQLAEQAGHKDPYAFQYLLGRAMWEADALRDEVREYSLAYLEDGHGVLSVDETGFLKKGQKSAGVGRQ